MAMKWLQQRWGNGRQHSGSIGSTRVAGTARRRPWRRRLQHSCNGQQGGRAAVAVAVAVAAWEQQQQRGNGRGSAVAVWWQCGGSAVAAATTAAAARLGGGGQLGSLVAALRQHGLSAASLVIAPQGEVWAVQWWWQQQCVGGNGQCVSSGMEAGTAAAAAANAVLPLVEEKITIVLATNKQ